MYGHFQHSCSSWLLHCLLAFCEALHMPQEKLNQLEADLGQSRNQMALGYTNPNTGKFEKASSVQLRNTMRTDASQDIRKACWEVIIPAKKVKNTAAAEWLKLC